MATPVRESSISRSACVHPQSTVAAPTAARRHSLSVKRWPTEPGGVGRSSFELRRRLWALEVGAATPPDRPLFASLTGGSVPVREELFLCFSSPCGGPPGPRPEAKEQLFRPGLLRPSNGPVILPPCATVADLPRFAPPACIALHVGRIPSLRASLSNCRNGRQTAPARSDRASGREDGRQRRNAPAGASRNRPAGNSRGSRARAKRSRTGVTISSCSHTAPSSAKRSQPSVRLEP